MEKLTNIIEAILFASGASIAVKELAEKLDVTVSDVKNAIEEIKSKFPADSGIQVLSFNGKIQLCTNPIYKDEVASVLNPIKEKEFTKTILECASIIAYKQPITRTELEMIRGVNSDYAIRTLLELEMIAPCGRRDTIGKPIVYATTDNFLKRFRLNSLDDLPDYDTLMSQIAKKNGENVQESYLYAKDTYEEEQKEEVAASSDVLPDFLKDLDPDSLITIE